VVQRRLAHADGYVVEVALPLQTIRFAAGPAVTMGVLFWRHVSRSGVSYSWPDMPSGQWVFDRHAQLVFDDLVPRRLVELLPSATWPMSQVRTAPDAWSEVSGHPEVGLSVKYGVTSQVTVDATVNPDFSQVESDAFQVSVNQRFPIFLLRETAVLHGGARAVQTWQARAATTTCAAPSTPATSSIPRGARR
jgi:hypothetical protein